LKKYKSPSRYQIFAELIQAEGETLRSEMQELIHCVWKNEELRVQRKESIILPIYNGNDKTDCSQSASYKMSYTIRLSTNKKQTPWSLVRKRTIPTEGPPLVGEI
jgi:hypothetical protein